MDFEAVSRISIPADTLTLADVAISLTSGSRGAACVALGSWPHSKATKSGTRQEPRRQSQIHYSWRVLEVPEVVANRARSVGADQWLEQLPETVARLSRAWGLVANGQAYDGGTEAFVMPVIADGFGPAVLKMIVPRDSGPASDAAGHEIVVLRTAGGTGCAALYRSDQDLGALLLEQLGPSLFDLGLALEERHRIQCRTAARMWRPVDNNIGLPTGARKANWLIDYINTTWNDLDRPCTKRAVEHALSCARRRIEAHHPRTATLVHGDVNDWNVLRTLDGADYKLIDPDGLVADPEYDLGVIMREDPLDLMAEADPMDRARRLAVWAQQHSTVAIDPVKIWEWGVVERVSTGLMAIEIDLQPIGSEMLEAADQLSFDWTGD